MPIRTLTTDTPRLPKTRKPTFLTNEVSYTVGALPFGRTTVLAVFTTLPMSSSCRRRMLKGSNRVGCGPHETEKDIVRLCEGFHLFSLEFLSETPRLRRQRGTDHFWSRGIPLMDTAGASHGRG